MAIAALALAGCLHFGAGPKPAPIADAKASICSIDPPPVLTRDEVAGTPRPLKRWTAGVKKSLENNGC